VDVAAVGREDVVDGAKVLPEVGEGIGFEERVANRDVNLEAVPSMGPCFISTEGCLGFKWLWRQGLGMVCERGVKLSLLGKGICGGRGCIRPHPPQ
jgi:hypothetical protein